MRLGQLAHIVWNYFFMKFVTLKYLLIDYRMIVSKNIV